MAAPDGAANAGSFSVRDAHQPASDPCGHGQVRCFTIAALLGGVLSSISLLSFAGLAGQDRVTGGRKRYDGLQTAGLFQEVAMTTNDSHRPNHRQASTPTVDDVFGASAPIQKAEDLARSGVFDDGEVEHFLADLHADVA